MQEAIKPQTWPAVSSFSGIALARHEDRTVPSGHHGLTDPVLKR